MKNGKNGMGKYEMYIFPFAFADRFSLLSRYLNARGYVDLVRKTKRKKHYRSDSRFLFQFSRFTTILNGCWLRVCARKCEVGCGLCTSTARWGLEMWKGFLAYPFGFIPFHFSFISPLKAFTLKVICKLPTKRQTANSQYAHLHTGTQCPIHANAK